MQPADRPSPDRDPSPPGPATVDWRVGLGVLAIVGAILTWWALSDGGYFEGVLYPGVIAFAATLALLAARGPLALRLGLSRPALAASVALPALGAWTLASGLWSPAPDEALLDGIRVLGYGAAFGIGLWAANLLGQRMYLACAPLAFAAAAAGIVTLLSMALAGPADLAHLLDEGTLKDPLGYRNATGAFFVMASWPAVALAALRSLDWRLRALSLATATLCFALAFLSQSRGASLGAAVGLLVLLATAPGRPRLLAHLLAAAVPAALALPVLADVYGADTAAAQLDALERAALAIALASVAAAGLLLGLTAVEPAAERRFAGLRSIPALRRGAAAAVAAALLGGLAVGVASGGLADFLDRRAAEVGRGGSLEVEGNTRFGFDARSNRNDVWTVAVDQFADAPVAGGGAGSFEYAYNRERELPEQTARDPHSVELAMLSELGLVGFLALVVALGASALGALRSRALGPGGAILSAAALAVGASWLAQGSVDWLWSYPAITTPALLLLGAACAPAARDIELRRPGRGRIPLAVACVGVALLAAPPLLADRYMDRAYGGWRSDLEGAYADLRRAAELNPLSETPLLAEGAIAEAVGQDGRALEAFREAAEKRPEEWATHYFLARLLIDADPDAAATELELARELNPLSPRLDSLQARLRHGPETGPASRGRVP